MYLYLLGKVHHNNPRAVSRTPAHDTSVKCVLRVHDMATIRDNVPLRRVGLTLHGIAHMVTPYTVSDYV